MEVSITHIKTGMPQLTQDFPKIKQVNNNLAAFWGSVGKVTLFSAPSHARHGRLACAPSPAPIDQLRGRPSTRREENVVERPRDPRSAVVAHLLVVAFFFL